MNTCERCGSQREYDGHALCEKCEQHRTNKDLREHLEWATQVVNSWPEWKRNILRDASKPMNDTPREPVPVTGKDALAEISRLRAEVAELKMDQHAKQHHIDELKHENEQLRSRLHRAVRVMVRAFLELNTIRARDGVPWTHMGYKASVTEEYFSSVADELDATVMEITNHSAHCHPELYK